MNKITFLVMVVAIFLVTGLNFVSANLVDILHGTEHPAQTCTESWSCGSWSSCNHDDESTRTCYDLHHCGNYVDNKRVETQDCDWNCYYDRDRNCYRNRDGRECYRDRDNHVVNIESERYKEMRNKLETTKTTTESQTKIVIVPSNSFQQQSSSWSFSSGSIYWIVLIFLALLVIFLAIFILVVELRRN